MRVRLNPSLYRAAGRWRWAAHDGTHWTLCVVEPTPLLDALLDRAQRGALLAELRAELMALDDEVSSDDAHAYVGQLVEQQLLVPEDPSPGANAGAANGAQPRGPLGAAALDLGELDAADLGRADREELRRGVALLHALDRSPDLLEELLFAFGSRFGDDEVPLALALDPEAGVGWPPGSRHDRAPLADGLRPPPRADASEPFAARDALLLDKVAAAWRSGAAAIDVALDELKQWKLSPRPLPSAFLVEGARLDHGRLRLDRVIALPPADGEPIGYLERRGLPLDDLSITFVDETLVLRSRRLGRAVRPRVAPLAGAPPIHAFLCALQQGGAPERLAFDWGPLASLASLPRVTSGRLVLWPRDEGGRRFRVALNGPPARPLPSLCKRASVRRTFVPGSEWLEADLHCGPVSSDAVLVELVAPLVERARGSGALAGWFFMRKPDPGAGLRVRLHGAPARVRGEVLADLEAAAEPMLTDGRLTRVALGTYRREIGRYGGDLGVLLAERIAEVDSDAVAALTAELDPDAGADARWRLALRGVDQLYADLGLDLAGKRAAVAEARRQYFAVAPSLQPQLDERWAQHAEELTGLIEREDDDESPLAAGLAILDRRSLRLRPLFAELRELEGGGRLGRSLQAQAPSFAHMFVNRFLRSASMAQETVIYHFLDRYYAGQPSRRAQLL